MSARCLIFISLIFSFSMGASAGIIYFCPFFATGTYITYSTDQGVLQTLTTHGELKNSIKKLTDMSEFPPSVPQKGILKIMDKKEKLIAEIVQAHVSLDPDSLEVITYRDAQTGISTECLKQLTDEL